MHQHGAQIEALATEGVPPPPLALHRRKAVGFRNLSVRNYDPIDWSIVHVIATRHLGDFEDFARLVVREQLAEP